MHRVLSLFLALLLLLPHGSLAAEPAAAYMETVIALPDDVDYLSSIQATPDGHILLLAQLKSGKSALLRIDDIAEMPEVLPIPLFETHQATALSVAPDGKLLVRINVEVGIKTDVGYPVSRDAYYFLSETGEEGPVIIPDMLGSQFVALPGHRMVLASYNEGTALYDETSTEQMRYATQGTRNIAVHDNTLYAFSYESIETYNIDAGDRLSTHSEFEYAMGGVSYVSPGGTVYNCGQDGVYSVDLQGGTQHQVISALDSLLGTGMYPKGVAVSGENFVLLLAPQPSSGRMHEANTVCYYTRAEGPDTRTPFYVDALVDDIDVRTAIAAFKRLHPELNVVYTVQYDRRSNQDVPMEDMIRATLAGLMAGNPSDVIVLDGLPMESLVRRGMLMDMRQLMKGLPILPGVLADNTQADGSIYGMPSSFQFQMFFGPRATLEDVKTLHDLVDAPVGPGQQLMAARPYDALIRLFYHPAEPDLMDANGVIDFTSDAFVSFLDTLYALYTMQDDMPDVGTFDFSEAEQAGIENGTIALYGSSIMSPDMLSMEYTVLGGEDLLAIPIPSVKGERSTYMSSGIVGIHAATQSRALCEELVSMILTQEGPQMGLPVTQPGIDAFFAKAREQDAESMNEFSLGISGQTYTTKQPDDAYLDMLQAHCEAVNAQRNWDQTLLDIIIEEAALFFDGVRTSRETGEAIQQRAQQYFFE